MSGGTTSGRVDRSWPNLTNVGPSSSRTSRRCWPRAEARRARPPRWRGPFAAEISLRPVRRCGRDQGHEIRAIPDVALYPVIPIIAGREPVTVDPHIDAGFLEEIAQSAHRRLILVRIADEDRALRHIRTGVVVVPRRRDRGHRLTTCRALLPARREFGDKLRRRTGQDFCPPAEMSQKQDQIAVPTGAAADQQFHLAPAQRQLPALGDAQQKPRQPVGIGAADEKQMIVPQRIEEVLGHIDPRLHVI